MNPARVITETPRQVLKGKNCAVLTSVETCLCLRKVGGGKIDSARRTLGRGKRGLAFHRPPQAYYLINAIGIPSGSLWAGERCRNKRRLLSASRPWRKLCRNVWRNWLKYTQQMFVSTILFASDLTLSLPECLMEFWKVTVTFAFVDEILWCDHSNESSLPVLTHGTFCFSKC